MIVSWGSDPSTWIWTQISTASFSRMIFYWHIRRSSDWNYTNTLFTYFVNVLTTTMIIHDDIGGMYFRYLSALLKCSNNRSYFWRSQSHTTPITIHRVVSLGHVLCPISAIKLLCARRWVTMAFMVLRNSPSRSSSYTSFMTRSSWCSPHQTWYIWCSACCSSRVTTPWIQPIIVDAPSEPTPRILDFHIGHIMSRTPEIRLYIFSEICRSNMEIARMWRLNISPLRWIRMWLSKYECP